MGLEASGNIDKQAVFCFCNRGGGVLIEVWFAWVVRKMFNP
jgi:hypothetical protein